jgi:transposase-like protein
VGGHKPSLNDKQKSEIRAMLKDPDISVTDIADRYGVSRTTLYKVRQLDDGLLIEPQNELTN